MNEENNTTKQVLLFAVFPNAAESQVPIFKIEPNGTLKWTPKDGEEVIITDQKLLVLALYDLVQRLALQTVDWEQLVEPEVLADYKKYIAEHTKDDKLE